jgi:hypothetical protein
MASRFAGKNAMSSRHRHIIEQARTRRSVRRPWAGARSDPALIRLDALRAGGGLPIELVKIQVCCDVAQDGSHQGCEEELFVRLVHRTPRPGGMRRDA